MTKNIATTIATAVIAGLIVQWITQSRAAPPAQRSGYWV